MLRKIPSAAAQRANSQAESLRSDKPLMFRLLVSLLKWLKPRRYADEGPRERSVESEWHYPEGDKRRTRRKFHRSAASIELIELEPRMFRMLVSCKWISRRYAESGVGYAT